MAPIEVLNMIVMALACNLLATVMLTVYTAILHRKVNQVTEDLGVDQRARAEQREQYAQLYLAGPQQPDWRGEWRP